MTFAYVYRTFLSQFYLLLFIYFDCGLVYAINTLNSLINQLV